VTQYYAGGQGSSEEGLHRAVQGCLGAHASQKPCQRRADKKEIRNEDLACTACFRVLCCTACTPCMGAPTH
jgi:hypothetical protein